MLHKNHLIISLLLACCCIFLASSSFATPETTVPTKPSEEQILTLGQATILGIVEGLTEYLPVSSTGHLLLAQRIMGIGENDSATDAQLAAIKEATDAYTICIQIGAIIAVLGLYFRRVKQMVRGLLGKDIEGRKLFINIIAGFLPAAVIGLLFNKLIKSYLFGTWPVVIAWFVGGLAILAVSRWNQKRGGRQTESGRSIIELTWQMALIIGFIQCIAMWPGVSRSLVTIVGGLLVGLSLSAAVEFSFLLGLITLSAATCYDALKHGQIMLQTFDVLSLTVGVIFAFLAAILSVKWMVSYLNRHGLAIFGYYRVVLALVTGLLLTTGTL
ncbi:undecaprenyl-diphosphatase [Desulfuromusa kysingii]|uniref:Undecaprenyl-diphosphatase n=1 Tax=Desulfuromusa kysingii TaxID=37625 RepID=A0A1H3W1P3_9BACT|nr:undecaprenyl-diphosphate phosphatase [Desulfuromusa kysingii]SDZ80890.1 undecaprenyl-diphosphatase [Desulfuromusa kysingii]